MSEWRAGAPATLLDPPEPGPGSPPTRADQSLTAGGPTRLDSRVVGGPPPDAPEAEPAAGGWPYGPPPRRLADRLTPVRRLQPGGQGDVLLCTDADGTLVILKIFHRPRPDQEEVWELWRQASGRHVVRLLGALTEEDRAYELTEYLPAGSLADRVQLAPAARTDAAGLVRRPLPEAEVESILAQLAAALGHIHRELALILVHRDIKPGNVLVSAQEPVEVRLTDFGLASAQTQTQAALSGSRTPPYAAPEVPHGISSPAGDWWSLGMTVLELLQGYHPFQGSDGGWLPEGRIGALIVGAPVPVDDSVGQRWRALFQGLLARDPDHRWGLEQVRAWLAGEAVPVPPEERTGSPFPFAGGVVYGPGELAAAIASHWGEAGALVAGRRWQDLRAWAATHSAELGAAVEEVDRAHVQRRSVDRAVAELMVRLDPAAAPSFMGAALHRSGLLALAGAATSDDEEADRIVSALFSSGSLRALAALQGQEELALVDERWHHWCELAEQAVIQALGSLDELLTAPHLRPMLLLTVLDPAAAARLEARARDGWRGRARRVPWFSRLREAARDAGEDAPAYHAVIALSAELAQTWRPELTPEMRARLAAQLQAPAGMAAVPAGHRPLVPGRGLTAALAACLAYAVLAGVAGAGVGFGTSLPEGVLSTTVLLLAGGSLLAARTVPRRVADALLGGWFGAGAGLVLATAAGIVTGRTLGSTTGWPVFWMTWVAAIALCAALGGAE